MTTELITHLQTILKAAWGWRIESNEMTLYNNDRKCINAVQASELNSVHPRLASTLAAIWEKRKETSKARDYMHPCLVDATLKLLEGHKWILRSTDKKNYQFISIDVLHRLPPGDKFAVSGDAIETMDYTFDGQLQCLVDEVSYITRIVTVEALEEVFLGWNEHALRAEDLGYTGSGLAAILMQHYTAPKTLPVVSLPDEDLSL